MTQLKSRATISLCQMREWLNGRASPSQGERCEFESRFPLQKKRLVSTSRFFNEINPFRICEMPFGREILLHNMKYALRRVTKGFILFHRK